MGENGNNGTDEKKDETKELAREFRSVEKWQLIINAGLGIVGIIALCIYHGQLKALLESNSINREALESVQRAFVVYHDVIENRHIIHDKTGEHAVWSFTMPWENTGTTPASITSQAFF